MRRLEAMDTYTDDEISRLARGGKQRGYIAGVGRVLPARATASPSTPAHDSGLNSLHKNVDFMMSIFKSDSKYSDMFSQFESGGASRSGGCGDEEEVPTIANRCRYRQSTHHYHHQSHLPPQMPPATTNHSRGDCLDTRKSTSGKMLSLGSCVVTWNSKKQEMFAFSSSKAEYAAVCNCNGKKSSFPCKNEAHGCATSLYSSSIVSKPNPVTKEGVTTNDKKENTSKAIIFQTLPQDVLMQVAQYSTAKEVWDSIKVKHLGADLFQKARLQTLRSEPETLRIKPNEKVSDFGGKLSSILAKFKGLGEALEDKVLVRKLLNSVPKKFLPIVATIEQYQDLDEMSFEEAIGRLTAYEERIKSQDTLKANGQDKLLMASSNNKTYGKWRGKDFNKEGKESMKWKNNPNARRASTSQGTKDKSKLRCYECG
nr:zinc finger, CCHC-type [Tanacetum cinerariifolium]